MTAFIINDFKNYLHFVPDAYKLLTVAPGRGGKEFDSNSKLGLSADGLICVVTAPVTVSLADGTDPGR